MAIVKAPALSLDASGNVGPICFVKWRGTNVARDTWTGTYPGTDKQIAANNRLTAVAQFWGSVGTTVDRDAWERYAETVTLINRLGERYIPTGYGIYMKLNLQRARWSLPILDEPLPRIEPEDPGVILSRLVLDPHQLQYVLGVGFSDPHDGYGSEYHIAGPYDSPGRKPIAGEWRWLSKHIPPFRSATHTIVNQKWYWGRARQIWASGWVGNWFIIQSQAL